MKEKLEAALAEIEALQSHLDQVRTSPDLEGRGEGEETPDVPPEIAALMEPGETIGSAKKRLWPILRDELADLKNKEALFGTPIPRKAEVETLIGILARVGEK